MCLKALVLASLDYNKMGVVGASMTIKGFLRSAMDFSVEKADKRMVAMCKAGLAIERTKLVYDVRAAARGVFTSQYVS